jgi:hypothetical protein
MNGKVLILSFTISAMLHVAANAATEDAGLLRDGFIISGVGGKVEHEKATDQWFFVFSGDVSDDKGRVGAGTKLEMLPCATLEKIEANVDKHASNNYRLWARVTRYGGKNYIYAIYVLPVTETEPTTGGQNTKVSINEPNDPLALPDEVVAKLKTKKIVHFEELEKGVELKEDSILADRIGFIVGAKEGDSTSLITGGSVFTLDAFGRSRGNFSLELLPCEVLERATGKSQMEPARLRVAGIVTRYKGKYYLLLQRVVRVYSHGNFD